MCVQLYIIHAHKGEVERKRGIQFEKIVNKIKFLNTISITPYPKCSENVK
jgi:hypothetical protein